MTVFTYAILFAGDMGRSVAFYRDIVGLPLKFESPEWSEFATGSTTLAIHIASGPPAEPKLRAPGQCNIGFSVPDLDEFHRKMQSNGVACLESPKTEDFGRMAVYADQDGAILTAVQART